MIVNTQIFRPHDPKHLLKNQIVLFGPKEDFALGHLGAFEDL